MKPKSIGIISNKGGVGKTHISINLALACVKDGLKTLLIDTDLGNADISNKIGLYPRFTLLDFLNKEKDIRSLIEKSSFGFDFIGSSTGDLRLANLVYAQKMKFINNFKKLSSNYDVIILDIGAGISKEILDFSLCTEETIIVTTPQDIVSGYACVKAAYLRYKELQKSPLDNQEKNTFVFQPKLIINQLSTMSQGEVLFNNINNTINNFININSAAIKITLSYLGGLIYDKETIISSESKRKPFLVDHAHTKLAEGILSINNKLFNNGGNANESKEIFSFNNTSNLINRKEERSVSYPTPNL